jgi:hypothetical protein
MIDEMGGFPFRAMSDCVSELYRWYQEHANLIDAKQLTFDDSE